MMQRLAILFLWCAAPMAAGCGTAVSSGTAIALSGYDLESMAEQMVQSITADPNVQEALNEPGPMRVVMLPVRNRLTGEVLPRGQQQAFVAQLRIELAKSRPDDFMWIVNRDDYYRLRDNELETIDLGPNPDAINPEYALQATFRSLTDDTKRRRTAFYSCLFELTNLEDRTTLWTDAYTVKKSGSKGFLD
ncbi:MAG: hypothetical protein AAGK78_13190 [Planctomycetota bacterium]